MEECQHKHIEEIVEARKRSGLYDALIGGAGCGGAKGRYAYSKPAVPMDQEVRRDEFAMYNIEGDSLSETRPTDSEITLIRVKREGSQLKRKQPHQSDGNNNNNNNNSGNWNMQDKAIPGDGSHLGESPSLVNLVTLVVPSKETLKTNKAAKEMEYMVPLSSWEPAEATLEEQEEAEQEQREEAVGSKSSGATIKDLFRCFIFWKRNAEVLD